MNETHLTEYAAVRETGAGFIDFPGRGIIEVSGGEAEMFLTGLITNDVKNLESGRWMYAAFPNAQGRLLAVVKVWKLNESYYFETEAETYETVLKNLERFTLAGDFRVRDMTSEFTCFSVQGVEMPKFSFDLPAENRVVKTELNGSELIVLNCADIGKYGFYCFVNNSAIEDVRAMLRDAGIVPVSDQAFEVLRIEAGLPHYGVDMDETTVVPEIGIDGLISYSKGCYIGQEVIARIHFRGHVAKQLTGLVFEDLPEPDASHEGLAGAEIKTPDDKNAGKITSFAYSPTLKKQIALGYVRYAFLEEGTQLTTGDSKLTVKSLPFLK
ncbi:MAG: folate-binding protein YgfZ [Pyrinomonadaceae bacterium]|nr:folate-binding protein YgfZ [Pyrinomonadaceae bacterium]